MPVPELGTILAKNVEPTKGITHSLSSSAQVTALNTSNPEGFMLALLPFVMIETAFCVVQSLSSEQPVHNGLSLSLRRRFARKLVSNDF
jgi:hypothetical protein